MFKKTRMRRKRVTVFDKLIRLVSMIPTSRKQRRAASNEPLNLYPGVKDRENKSRTLSRRWTSWTLRRRRTSRTSSRRQKSTEKMTREAIKHPRIENCTLNSTWMVNLKRKRSKTSTRMRDLSSFVNDLSKIQVSEAFLLRASSVRTQGSAKFAACMAAEDEGPQNLVMEQHILPQDNSVSCNESIQKSPTEFGNCVLGVEIDIPDHSLEIDILNYQVEGHRGSKEKFDPSTRRKPLPKVDLDAETMRVWNLLMENNGTDDTEQEDDDKAKYWKKQREIFDGRVDSFIARMHLIQG
ncbi:UNVERIFIED_CONTAM: DNA glycosylase/AP lyase ROS1 [Sesamum calycinum]|uniref:DNA glycosylase/AP lyase ROS1 n=1 Tax=Sesamum calycinum TaxID=2727403 RepID=A0AAW2SBY4_9LAMI